MAINIPFAEFIADKEVLLFQYSNEVQTPHLYICVKKAPENVLMMVLSTTNHARLQRFVANNGLHPDTIVPIQPNYIENDSPLRKPSWINCNDVYLYTIEEINQFHRGGAITPIQDPLPERYYEQIVNGICLSDNIDEEIKDLFR
jgi:hypothetical protein